MMGSYVGFNMSLVGKTALVCGSTQGIGKAAAIALAQLGANVILAARNETSLKQVLSELNEIKHPTEKQNHSYVCCDFDDPAGLQKVVKEEIIERQKITVNILVNNSGGPPPSNLLETDFGEVYKGMARLLECSHNLVKTVVPGMKQSGYGRIINVISLSVREPIPTLGVSNTIRGATASWAKTLASELAPDNVTVNSVLPGFIDTQRMVSLVKKKSVDQDKSTSCVKEELCSQIPLGRFGEPREMGETIAFLASPAASFITGTAIPIDGGRLKAI
eukprot:Nk52_evm37s1737 gene=Nk52_evmTU37s1737